jgi:Flp pilus assembly protein TadB
MSHPSPTADDKTDPGRRTFTLRPVDDDGEFTRTGIWLMVGGCCLSLPLALMVLALTGSTLVGARPTFIAIFGVAAAALAIIAVVRNRRERRLGHPCC